MLSKITDGREVQIFACKQRLVAFWLFAFWATCCLNLAIPSIALGQPPDENEVPLPPIVAETEEFKTAIDNLREHLKVMREAVLRYNMSETKPEERKWKEEWYSLIAEGHRRHELMVQAALNEYKSNPAEKSAIAELLNRKVDKDFEEDRYEGILEIAQTLLDNQYPNQELPRYLASAAYALGRFDIARPYFEEMLGEGKLDAKFADTIKDLEKAQAMWEEEVAIREQDAAGEPLPHVLIRTTKGDIEIELFENQAPETVGNFISLIENEFYTNLAFHRVMEHFMVQGGCPIGDGTGDAGYSIYNEADKPDARRFFRGTLAMALDPRNPNSASSQFFITLVPTPDLFGQYTAFGRVVSGIEVLSNLTRINPDDKDPEATPATPDEIREIKVLSKRAHEYKPNKVDK
jgi:cyclophilin family peptidyl-prolyl cis-trans isomerase